MKLLWASQVLVFCALEFRRAFVLSRLSVALTLAGGLHDQRWHPLASCWSPFTMQLIFIYDTQSHFLFSQHDYQWKTRHDGKLLKETWCGRGTSTQTLEGELKRKCIWLTKNAVPMARHLRGSYATDPLLNLDHDGPTAFHPGWLAGARWVGLGQFVTLEKSRVKLGLSHSECTSL